MSKDKNEIKRARPLSPHLTIYKPQISSMLSIGHRLSGIGLFVAIFAICWWFICWVFNDFDPAFVSMLDNIFVKAFLGLVVYGFFYHLSTGIRHLIWDMGYGFSICSVSITGWIAVLASIVLTVLYLMIFMV